MSSIGWTAIKNAIQAWIVRGSGLSVSRVLWTGQNAARPAGLVTAYISIKIKGFTLLGSDWIDVEDNPLVIADDIVESVDFAANTLTLTAHGLTTGDGPVQLTTTTTLPAPLELETDYWVIVTSANLIKLASSRANAIAATPVPVDITDAGVGTHTLVDTAETRRVGAEVAEKVRGCRTIQLQITCWPPIPATDATEAAAILSEVVAHAGTNQTASAFVVAGCGMTGLGPVTPIDGVINSTRFEPRATMPVAFHVVSELVILATDVAEVIVTGEYEDRDDEVTTVERSGDGHG